MTFPTRFKHLIEMDAAEVERPRHVVLRYAVCGRETHSCGWQGWTLDGAWRAPTADEDETTYSFERLVPGCYADVSPPCPECGRGMVVTDIDAWFGPTEPLACSFEYDVAPNEYVDDPDRLLADEYLPLGLKRIQWRDRQPEADDWHEHCNVCFARISDEDFDQHEAMSDGLYTWACLTCWERISRAGES